MSVAEVLSELSAWTISDRQLLVTRALELDDRALSAEDEALIESRLAGHRNDPASSVSLEAMKSRLRLLIMR
jgi:hypothetical protein